MEEHNLSSGYGAVRSDGVTDNANKLHGETGS